MTHQYPKNYSSIQPIFYLRLADQIQNIPRELCYHARFFTATDFNKRVSKDERYEFPLLRK